MARQCRQTAVRLFITLAVLVASLLDAGAVDAVNGLSRGDNFVVYSRDRAWRTKVLRTAESASALWAKTLGDTLRPSAPILIVDRTRDGVPHGNTAIATGVFETDGMGMKVQVEVYESAGLRGGSLEAEIFRAMAYHVMFQKNPPRSGRTYSTPPGWFIEGLTESLCREDGKAPDGLYEALVRSGRPPNIQEFLKQKPERLDGTSLSLYRAQALALINALVKNKESQNRLGAFMQTPEFSESQPDSLLAAFPELKGDMRLLSKVWTLEIARSTMPAKLSSLSVSQTDKELAGILAMPAFAKAAESMGNQNRKPSLSAAAQSQGGGYLMRQSSIELLNLEFRGHPFMRPIISEYRSIVEILARKPKTNLVKRIDAVERTRSALLVQSEKIADYLNWYEATQLEVSEVSILDEFREPDIPKRNDPITLYMDGIEARGW